MIVEAITYFMQVLTYFLERISYWEISQGVTIASIILWYLSIMVILWIIGRIVTGSVMSTHKNGGKQK